MRAASAVLSLLLLASCSGGEETKGNAVEPPPRPPDRLTLLVGGEAPLAFVVFPVDYGEGDPRFYHQEVERLTSGAALAAMRLLAAHFGSADGGTARPLGRVELELVGAGGVVARSKPADFGEGAAARLLDPARWVGASLPPGASTQALIALDADPGRVWTSGVLTVGERRIELRPRTLPRVEWMRLIAGEEADAWARLLEERLEEQGDRAEAAAASGEAER